MLNKRQKRRLVKKREKRDVKRGCVFGKRRERGREKERGGRGEQDDALGLVPVPDPVPGRPVPDLGPDPDQDPVLGVETRAEVGAEVGAGAEIGEEGGDAK